MAASKGNNYNPNGRPKGTANKATSDARAAIAEFVEGNVDRLTAWLDQIAQGVPLKNKEGAELYSKDDDTLRYKVPPDPQGAFDSLMSVVEYHIPKLARSELTGKDGKDLNLSSLVENSLKEK